MGTSRESAARILRVAGFAPELSIYESGVLARIIWDYVSERRCTVDSMVDLSTPLPLVHDAVQSLKARGVIHEHDGALLPLKYMEWEQSDERRREALAEYNKKKVSDLVSRIEGLNVETVKKFNEFWQAYPKPRGRVWHKTLALRAFTKALRVAPFERIMEGLAIAKQSDQWMRDNGAFIPMPSTFLNQCRWEDFLAAGHQNVQSEQQKNGQCKTVRIAGRTYTRFDPPRRDQFKSDREYVEARTQWTVWLSTLS